jgi:hypothetical protein
MIGTSPTTTIGSTSTNATGTLHQQEQVKLLELLEQLQLQDLLVQQVQLVQSFISLDFNFDLCDKIFGNFFYVFCN